MIAQLSPKQRARLLASQRVLSHAIATPAATDIAPAQRSGYPELQLESPDRRALAAADPRRLQIYRKLVRGTLIETLELQLPKTIAVLGEQALRRYSGTFFESMKIRSPLLRDFAFEFAAWAEPRWRSDPDLPPFLGDLARYELLKFDVRASPRRNPQASAGLQDGQTVAFEGSARLARLSFAVNELPAKAQQGAVVDAREMALLGYRDAHNRCCEVLMSALVGEVFAALLVQGRTLADAVMEACHARGRELDETVGQEVLAVLSDLTERGVALGGRAAGPLEPPSPFFSWLLASR